MSNEEAVTYATLSTKQAGKPTTVEAFFVAKLGSACGRRLFKELAEFAHTALKSSPESVGVIFNDNGGTIVGINRCEPKD